MKKQKCKKGILDFCLISMYILIILGHSAFNDYMELPSIDLMVSSKLMLITQFLCNNAKYTTILVALYIVVM